MDRHLDAALASEYIHIQDSYAPPCIGTATLYSKLREQLWGGPFRERIGLQRRTADAWRAFSSRKINEDFPGRARFLRRARSSVFQVSRHSDRQDWKAHEPGGAPGVFGPTARRVANAIVAQGLALAQNDVEMNPRIGDRVIIPETVFSCDPTPGAFTDIRGEGEIQLNLGLFFAFIEMTRTIAWFGGSILQEKRYR